MKILIVVLVAFFAIGTSASAQSTAANPKKEVQKTMYTCPMHPKEMSEKKGQCSKCSMDLVKSKVAVQSNAGKGNQTTPVVKNKYVCTMDGATSDKPGKCPKCSMKMTEKKMDSNEMKH
jgi:hypothetical protein